MIIDSTGSNKITIGQTTEYKTTIDIENLDFIATLLSSNLYSNPEESFIREIVSNGWDSHVEANNTNTPIIVRVKRSTENYCYDITIRDYGTGLSKEDFENLYCKIGSSTKRKSNDYLGMFGLGHLSPLSVSKVVYVTSYYDGIARFYIMTKDGNNITTNLMSETPTNEHNGLEITVKNQYAGKYENALTDLMFFPNVYIDGIYEYLNKIQIKRFKYFSVASRRVDKKILFGNVLYPLNKDVIPSDLLPFYEAICGSGIVLNFNIGEFTVTPNRESIIYNTKTNELIIKRIKEARDEITSIINPHISKDFTNPFSYYNLVRGTSAFNFIDNKLVEAYMRSDHFRFDNSIIPFNATLKGRSIPVSECITIRRCEGIVPKYRGVIVNDKVYTSEKKTWDCNRVINDTNSNVIIIPSDQKLTCYAKSYLTISNIKAVICGLHTYQDYLDEYLQHFQKPSTTEDFIIKACYDYFVSRCKTLDLDTDKEFLEYKEELRKQRKENRTVDVKEVILTIANKNICWASPNKRKFGTYKDALDYIKSLKGGIIYRNLDTMQIWEVATYLGYNVIGANKSILKLLSEENFTHRITEETIKSNPMLVKLKTLYTSKLQYCIQKIHSTFINTLSKDLKEEFYSIKNLVFGRHALIRYVSNNIDSIPLDENLLNIYNLIAECYEEYANLINNLNIENPSTDINTIISYIIMKNKLYKVGYDCYKQIKENKIISQLCKN